MQEQTCTGITMEEKQVPQAPNLLEEVRTPICRHFYLWQVVYHMASTRLFTILPKVYLPKAIYHLTGFPSTTYVNVCAEGRPCALPIETNLGD